MTADADHLGRLAADRTEQRRSVFLPEISLRLTRDFVALWERMASVSPGCPPPYWACAWPGGLALARCLLDHPDWVRACRVVDLGAGSGVVGLAALLAGAESVLAIDTDPLAAWAIGQNAAANGLEARLVVSTEDVLAGGFHDEPAMGTRIVVGDLCYERPLADRLWPWLRASVARGCRVMMGDPGRAYLRREGLRLVGTYRVPTDTAIESATFRETMVLELGA